MGHGNADPRQGIPSVAQIRSLSGRQGDLVSGLSIGSLFSGIGGLELGLEWAGLGPTVWQVEQDPFCQRVLAKHWPDAQRFDDVRTVGASNLGPVDLICGGFPCQDLSYAGKGAGLAGARSGLWTEYARIVGELLPRFVVVENVAALAARGLDRVLGDLAALGYDAVWLPVRAADVGAPHRRERLFIVAYARRGQVQRRGESREFPSSAGEAENAGDERKRMRYSSSDGNQALANPRSCRCERGAVEQPRGDGTRYELHREQVASDTGKRCTTLADADDKHDNRGRPSAGILPERRSPEARLQRQRSQSRLGREHTGFSAWLDRGFPAGPSESSKEWEAARTIKTCPDRPARLKALGNAVLPQVAYVIGCIVQELAQAASKGGG